MEIILDMQGFQNPYDVFVLKKLAAITVQADDAGRYGMTRILFKPPCSWETLPPKCRATNSWLTRNYHELEWNDGDLSYDKVQKVLEKIVEPASYVYVKRNEKKQWIEKIINDDSKPVIDLEELGCPSLGFLQYIKVGGWHEDYHGKIVTYRCAWENIQRLKSSFLKDYTESLEKSLHIYLQARSLKGMRKEDIAFLTKQFILIYASDIIDEIWDKLSEAMKTDEDIISCLKYRKSKHHYWLNDEFDGPIPK